jgi:hypothetical protein
MRGLGDLESYPIQQTKIKSATQNKSELLKLEYIVAAALYTRKGTRRRLGIPKKESQLSVTGFVCVRYLLMETGKMVSAQEYRYGTVYCMCDSRVKFFSVHNSPIVSLPKNTEASFKDFQATGEAYSPQKRNIQHSKKLILLFFFNFCGSVLHS